MTDLVAQLLVDGPAARRRVGAADHGRLPRQRRLVHRAGRPRAPVRAAGRRSSASPEWLDDPRFATREGWRRRTSRTRSVPRSRRGPADKTKLEACDVLAPAGIAAGPCNTAARRHRRPARRGAPHARRAAPHRRRRASRCSIPGNPSRCRRWPKAPRPASPWVGEHTDEVLRAELGLSDDELATLRHGARSTDPSRTCVSSACGARLSDACSVGYGVPPKTVFGPGSASEKPSTGSGL